MIVVVSIIEILQKKKGEKFIGLPFRETEYKEGAPTWSLQRMGY